MKNLLTTISCTLFGTFATIASAASPVNPLLVSMPQCFADFYLFDADTTDDQAVLLQVDQNNSTVIKEIPMTMSHIVTPSGFTYDQYESPEPQSLNDLPKYEITKVSPFISSLPELIVSFSGRMEKCYMAFNQAPIMNTTIDAARTYYEKNIGSIGHEE